MRTWVNRSLVDRNKTLLFKIEFMKLFTYLLDLIPTKHKNPYLRDEVQAWEKMTGTA